MILEKWGYEEKTYSYSTQTYSFNSKIIKLQGFNIPLKHITYITEYYTIACIIIRYRTY